MVDTYDIIYLYICFIRDKSLHNNKNTGKVTTPVHWTRQVENFNLQPFTNFTLIHYNFTTGIFYYQSFTINTTILPVIYLQIHQI